MDIKLKLEDVGQLQALLRQFPAIAERHLAGAINEGVMLLQREIAEATPTGANQLLRKSIKGETAKSTGGQLLGVVGTALDYAIPVELGTQPHFPPVAPLEDWVVAKLGIERRMAHGVAYLIARKIAAKGTQGAFMFKRTVAAQEGYINGLFKAAVAKTVQELGR